MQGDIRRIIRQPGMAIGTSILAGGLLALAFVAGVNSGVPLLAQSDLLLGAGLAVSIIFAYQFPIYLRHHTTICLISLPLLLGAVLLSPLVCGCLTVLSITIGELTVRGGRRTDFADIATMAARWTVAVVMASALTHVVAPGAGPVTRAISVIVAALMMGVIDIVSLPLVLTPISGESPASIIAGILREGGIIEAVQYGLALAGVVLAGQTLWAILFLFVPAVLVQMAFTKRLDADTLQFLENVADTIDLRGSYTAGHSRRVRDLVAGILSELNVRGQEATQILTASRLHDVGRVGLPDDLLINPGTLTARQQALLEVYPESGVEFMRQYPDFARGLEMIRHHHERWDGMGYPTGLAGTDIPFGARVIAVADSYDAMTSERPYRRALTPVQAARILLDGAGRQWDPDVVSAFLHSIGNPARQVSTDLYPDAFIGVGARSRLA